MMSNRTMPPGELVMSPVWDPQSGAELTQIPIFFLGPIAPFETPVRDASWIQLKWSGFGFSRKLGRIYLSRHFVKQLFRIDTARTSNLA